MRKLLAVSMLAALGGVAHASMLYVDVDATGAGTGASWADAYADLQPALAAATWGDEIRVAEGTYRPTSGTDRTVSFVLVDGVAVRGGFAGFGESTPDERDVAAHETILSGDIGAAGDDADNSCHVVVGASDTTLDGFTIASGNAKYLQYHDAGGMFNKATTNLTVMGCRFEGNRAREGAAMSNSYGSSVTVRSCVFVDNEADSWGGAIYVSISSSATVVNCTLAGNSALMWGGAIYSETDLVTVTNCILWDNVADYWSEIRTHLPIAVTYSCVKGGYEGTGNIGEHAGHAPLFVDAAGGDCHIQAGSRCIDAGDGDVAPATDMEGKPRFDDTGTSNTGVGAVKFTDMGAYEFQEATPTGIWVNAPPEGLWWTGRDVAITWIDGGDVGNVKIELSRDGGTSWDVLTSSTSNDRHFLWTVTDGGEPIPQRDCRVRVSEAATDVPAGISPPFTIFDGVWYVDADAPAGGDGLTWASAFQHPLEALSAAYGGDEIWVAEGTFKPTSGTDRTISFELVDGVAVYGGFAGTETARDQRDWTVNESILSGDIGVADIPDDNTHNVVKGVSNAVLDGFTITAGNADGSWPGNNGGGMRIYDHMDNLDIVNCTFRGNQALGAGGLYCGSSSPNIANCAFTGNWSNYDGGAIRIGGSSSPVITDCIFSGNSASNNGGAMFIENSSPTILSCVFAGNSVGESGGAVLSRWSSSPVFINCTFTGNRAAISAAALYSRRSSPSLTNCILWNDNAQGIPEIRDYQSSTTTATFSLVRGGLEGTGNTDLPPLFVDPGHWDDGGTPADPSDDVWVEGDYRLQAGSPCIDAGDGDAAPLADIEGNPRYDDLGLLDTGVGAVRYVDIGAYERQGDTAGSWIQIYDPAPGVAWRVGRVADVQWIATSDAPDVKIEVSRSGGPWEAIAASTSNDRRYAWAVDDGGQALPQRDCRIRISDAADGVPEEVSGLFAVFSGVWYVNETAPPGGDGLTWASAFQHPLEALSAAYPGDEIWVAAGTYKPTGGTDRAVSFTLADGVAVYGGFAGTETARDQRDWTVNESILSGDIGVAGDDSDNSYHVVLGASDSRLDGLTVTGGYAVGAQGSGGGMLNEYIEGSVVENCTFEFNYASSAGGGMYGRFSDTSVINSTFADNVAGYGGGIYGWNSPGPSHNPGVPVIHGCVFVRNTALDEGGGIRNSDCPVVVSECLFEDNLALGNGGGMSNNYAAPVVVGCTFQGNSTDFNGGALHAVGTASLATYSSCVFQNNTAGFRGGAAYNGSANTEFINCTMNGNLSVGGYAGGVNGYASGTILVSNSILWGDSQPEIEVDAGVTCDVARSCIQGGHAGEGNTSADPLFVDAAAGDLHFQADSPCIDSADGDKAPATDIEGGLRQDEPGVMNTGVGTPPYADMGAYEFQSAGGESMTVLTPNGGEFWDAGGVEQVTWTSAADPIAEVRIGLSRDGGATWEYIDGGTSVANVGSFAWNVTGPASAECLVRVVDASDGTPADRSDSPLTVREVMTVSLGQSAAAEGDGTLNIGTVSIPTALASSLTVALVSGDATEVTVPTEVVMPAGLTSVDFDVTIVDDWVIDGGQTVTITASAAAYLPGIDSLLVIDNESQTITMAIPTSAAEGNGTLADQGQVTIPGTWATDLVIELTSNDATELSVPATIIIPQGTTSTSFDLVVEDDGSHDGTQTVTVTATAAGWAGDSSTIDIADDDPATPFGGGCAPGAGSPLVMLLAVGAMLAIVQGRRLVTGTAAKEDRETDAATVGDGGRPC